MINEKIFFISFIFSVDFIINMVFNWMSVDSGMIGFIWIECSGEEYLFEKNNWTFGLHCFVLRIQYEFSLESY